jgi:glutathione S-transferase
MRAMKSAMRPVVHHIPVCPFSQRLEILLALKALPDAVEFRKVDITRPRDPALLEKTRGTTALPVLETEAGEVLKESLVLLRYLDERFGAPIRRADPYEHAVENLLIALEGEFTAGYRFVMNRDRARRGEFEAAMLGAWGKLDDMLAWKSPGGPFLFDRFGLAETVFTPMFVRFAFLDYYEDFQLPQGRFERARRWRDACLEHPAAQQVTSEEVVKVYYDYALGAGNGALPQGRTRSSFVFEPDWRERPWPPRDKWGAPATDAELGLA